MNHSVDIARDQIDRLAEDFLARYRRGERPTGSEIDQYAKRFPEIGDQVADVIQVLLLMENLGAESAGGSENESIPIPEQLGEYRIVRELGRGGMGVVYEAIQSELGRRVALKVLPAVSLLRSSQLERFRREAKAAARLHHSNIVPVFGVGSSDGVHYYAMQLIRGRSLDHVLREIRRQRSSGGGSRETIRDAEARTSPSAVSGHPNRTEFARSVARIGQQVADALGHAHGQGLLHRDVKPSNIIVDEDGRAWLSDFGLALLDDCEQLTGEGDAVGTLRYMAPERFKGKGDARSDVYSLGLTLYELLATDLPVSNVDRATLIHQVLHEEPPAPRSVDPTVPRDLETIILKAIRKEPAHRYQTAAELAEDLGRFLLDRPPAARRLGWWERTWRWIQRNRALTAMTATALAALLLGLVTTYSQWQRAMDHLVEANRQTERAKKGHAAVSKMVDGIFSAFSDDSSEPRSTQLPLPIRKQLLALAIDHHRELTALSDEDPESLAILAQSCLRIAEVQFSVGRELQAVESCEQAEELLWRATKLYPEHTELRALLATVTSQLGYYQLTVNRVAAARESLDRAIALWIELSSNHPAEPELLNGLAKSYNCLGYLLSPAKSRRENLDESLRYHQLAVEIRQRIVDENSESLVYKRSLALALFNLADRKAQAGQFVEAIALQEEGNALFAQLLASEPDSTDYAIWLAKGHNHLGDKLRDCRELADRFERAMQEYLQALDAQERLVNQNPGLVPLKRDLANTLNNLSDVHRRQNEYEQALKRSEQVLALFDEMQLQEPQSIVGEAVASAWAHHARVLKELGRPDDAIASYYRAIQGLQELVENKDERPAPRAEWSRLLSELVPLLRQTERFGEAIELAEQRRRLAAGKPEELFAVAHDLAETASGMAHRLAYSRDPAGFDAHQQKPKRAAAEVELCRAADLALAVLKESIAAGWNDFASLLPQTMPNDPFAAVWQNADYTSLPTELAFAFDVRARRHLARVELDRAIADWWRLAAQGHSAPNTYRALLHFYVNIPYLR